MGSLLPTSCTQPYCPHHIHAHPTLRFIHYRLPLQHWQPVPVGNSCTPQLQHQILTGNATATYPSGNAMLLVWGMGRGCILHLRPEVLPCPTLMAQQCGRARVASDRLLCLVIHSSQVWGIVRSPGTKPRRASTPPSSLDGSCLVPFHRSYNVARTLPCLQMSSCACACLAGGGLSMREMGRKQGMGQQGERDSNQTGKSGHAAEKVPEAPKERENTFSYGHPV